jgi:hypothetical protein
VVRVYICPVIGSGTKADPYRSKAQTFGYQYASFMRSNPDGSSAIAWTLTVAASQDFTAIDADATCDDVFAGDLPANVNTRPELLAFLRNRTVGDIPATRRSAVLAVLWRGRIQPDHQRHRPVHYRLGLVGVVLGRDVGQRSELESEADRRGHWW